MYRTYLPMGDTLATGLFAPYETTASQIIRKAVLGRNLQNMHDDLTLEDGVTPSTRGSVQTFAAVFGITLGVVGIITVLSDWSWIVPVVTGLVLGVLSVPMERAWVRNTAPLFVMQIPLEVSKEWNRIDDVHRDMILSRADMAARKFEQGESSVDEFETALTEAGRSAVEFSGI